MYLANNASIFELQSDEQGINWWLLVLLSYTLTLQKISILLNRHRTIARVLADSLAICAVIAVVAGGYSSYRNWQYNRQQQAVATHLIATANHHAAATHNQPQALAPATVPSTRQPDTSAIAAYEVAPNMPRYLIIPKLGVQARILAVGLDANGSIGTPDNVFDTAWYDHSALPGNPGAMLVDGHISSWTSRGVFYNLDKLSAGDMIEVQRGDSQVFRYTVVKTVVYGSNNVDMNQALRSVNPNRPGLNLISCYGSVISGTSDFNKRIVVYASAS